MEIFAHPWQLALLCFVAGFLLARWMYRYRSNATPPPCPEITNAEIEAALRAGRKVDAIKLYRQKTGASLKDALQAVETMASRIGPV